MKVRCENCGWETRPVKANKNIFSLDAKCEHCGKEIDISDSKTMLNIGRFMRIPCYIVMALVIVFFSQHMPTDFKSFVMSLAIIVVVVAVVYAVYCLIGNIIIFGFKK